MKGLAPRHPSEGGSQRAQQENGYVGTIEEMLAPRHPTEGGSQMAQQESEAGGRNGKMVTMTVHSLRNCLSAVFSGSVSATGPVAQDGGPSGSFNQALAAWEALPGVDQQVVKWLREGVDQRPGPSCCPRPWNLWGGSEFNAVKNEEEARWLRDEHQRWLREGISEPIGDDDREGFWHPLKVVPKAGWQNLPVEQQWRKKYRLCLAVARTLNTSLTIPRLRMETLPMALRLVEERDVMVVGDLEAGYNHMLLHPACRCFYRYRVDGRSFQMRVLFFGLATAPYIFSRTVSQLWKFLRRPQENTAEELNVKRLGLRASGFLDDLIVVERQERMSVVLSRWVWPVSAVLGFCWGVKCRWAPSTSAKYLGLVVDSAAMMVRLPKDKCEQIKLGARYVLKTKTVQILTLLRTVGRLRAAALAIPWSQLFAWELGRLVAPVVQSELPHPERLEPRALARRWKRILRLKVMVTDGARRALSWVVENLSVDSGRRWRDDNLQWLVVDASSDRAGAKLGPLCASVPFPAEVVTSLHNNQSRREVFGSLLGLQAFQSQLAGQRVAILSDNKGQVATLNQMRNGALAPWVAEALWFCLESGIELHKSAWIPSREMVRRGVDGLSRFLDVNDWGLSWDAWRVLNAWAEGLQVDRFADSLNRKLPIWNSRFHEPGTTAVDAFAQDWTQVRNYACPPLALLGRVIDLVRSQKAATVLVVPHWPGQIWWPLLLRLAPETRAWLRLGLSREVIGLGRSGQAAPLRHNWEFWAVKLFWT
jgi:hypothetical protein